MSAQLEHRGVQSRHREFTCKGCGERFRSSRIDAECCSPKCRQRYKRRCDKTTQLAAFKAAAYASADAIRDATPVPAICATPPSVTPAEPPAAPRSSGATKGQGMEQTIRDEPARSTHPPAPAPSPKRAPAKAKATTARAAKPKPKPKPTKEHKKHLAKQGKRIDSALNPKKGRAK